MLRDTRRRVPGAQAEPEIGAFRPGRALHGADGMTPNEFSGRATRAVRKPAPGHFRHHRLLLFRKTVQALSLGLFLYLFFYVTWPYAEVFTETTFSSKEAVPADLFLKLDPLAGISAAIAGRRLNMALFWVGGIFLVCILVPRLFCSHLCPLGTCIDAFDGLMGRLAGGFRRHMPARVWSGTRYYLLAAVLLCSVLGVLTTGFVSPTAILTRGMLFTGGRLQRGALRGWEQLGAVDWTFHFSIALFALVFAMSLFGRRAWCRIFCPAGGLLSILSAARLSERRVTSDCTQCGRCMQVCRFDAVEDNAETRTANCTMCGTCAAQCPVEAITYEARRSRMDAGAERVSPRGVASTSRRGFLAAAVGAVAIAGCKRLGLVAANSASAESTHTLIRPPGSVSEDLFLRLCIRCGQCIKACPGPVLHAAGLEGGLDAMWTPIARMAHAACHQDCNFCTQVCPTGAIRPLDIREKRRTRMGVAVVGRALCVAYTGEQDCRLCYDECRAAGYHAIELRKLSLSIPSHELPPEGLYSAEDLYAASAILAPVVDPLRCVGCGLCEFRCHKVYVEGQRTLPKSAIAVRGRARRDRGG